MGKSAGTTNKYNGLTRKQYKKKKANEGTNSTRGIDKNKACQADSLTKGMTKYPRHYRTNSGLYTKIQGELDRQEGRKTFSGGTK